MSGIYSQLAELNKATPTKRETPIVAETLASPTPDKKRLEMVKQTVPHDTTVSRHHDTTLSPAEKLTVKMVEKIRKVVKQVGKEAATHRFTVAEKEISTEIIYQYKRKGIITTENEITRIAFNYIAQDYKQHQENSILHQLLKALNN